MRLYWTITKGDCVVLGMEPRTIARIEDIVRALEQAKSADPTYGDEYFIDCLKRAKSSLDDLMQILGLQED